MEIVLSVFTRFCRFSKRAFCRKSPISTGRNGQLKPGKLLDLIWHIWNKMRQFSISLLRYLGTRIFLNDGLFIDSPGMNLSFDSDSFLE